MNRYDLWRLASPDYPMPRCACRCEYADHVPASAGGDCLVCMDGHAYEPEEAPEPDPDARYDRAREERYA